MTAPVPTLRVDTSGTAFGVAPTWTDRTTYLMAGTGYPVNITFGRGDELSEVQASACSFYLKNDTGFWTPGSAAAPANWDVGCPVNIRLTANAVTYDRFTGYVDSIEPTWPGGVQSWSVVKVTATDATARLGRAKPLRSILHYEMLADSPSHLYPLNEAAGATSAADVSGNGRTPCSAVLSDTSGVCNFGTNMEMFDESTGVSFATTATASAYLALAGETQPTLFASGAYTVSMWVRSSTDTVGNWQMFLLRRRGADVADQQSGLYFGASGEIRFNIIENGENTNIASANSYQDGGLHFVAATLGADRKTMRLYVDGVQVASTTRANAVGFASLTTQSFGGFRNDNGVVQNPLRGTMARLAIYPSELSAARILAHYQAGIGTAPAERSDQRFSRIAGYGGIATSGLPTGAATMTGQSLAGKPAIDALRDVARTESGACYVTPAGALTFQARSHRYQKAVGLTLAASDIETPNVRRDRQGQFNELTVTRAGGASQVYVDSARQSADGRFDGGSFEVAPDTDADAYQNAAWQVNNHKTPQTRLPDLTVNMLRQTNNSLIANCLNATISTVVQVTGLPSNAPGSTMNVFVEGYNETIAYDDWRIAFFTSPVLLEDNVWILEDATYGVIDSTNVIAF